MRCRLAAVAKESTVVDCRARREVMRRSIGKATKACCSPAEKIGRVRSPSWTRDPVGFVEFDKGVVFEEMWFGLWKGLIKRNGIIVE